MSPSSFSQPPLSQLTPQRVLKVLRQPSAIAVLASIAVHGLLAITLPLLPMNSEEPKKPRPVKVVALTPAERSRLPSGFGSGSGSGLKSANPLPLDLPPSFQIPPPSPLYSFPPAAQLDPYPVEQTRPDPVPDTPTPSGPQTKPSDKPSPGNKGNSTGNGSPGNGEPGNGGPGNGVPVCPTPPDSSPACKEQREAQNRKLWAFNPADTDPELVGGKLADFGEKLKTISKGQMLINYGLTSVKLPYSEQACRYISKAKQDEKRLSVTAILAPDGRFAEEPKISTSSGYAPMDAEAIAYVIEKVKQRDDDEFKPGKEGKYRGLYVPFTFQPETACAAKS